MSRSSNLFIAQTQGFGFTMYAVMRALGLPLTKEQEEFQSYLERKYSTVVDKEDTYLTVQAEDYGSGGGE